MKVELQRATCRKIAACYDDWCGNHTSSGVRQRKIRCCQLALTQRVDDAVANSVVAVLVVVEPVIVPTFQRCAPWRCGGRRRGGGGCCRCGGSSGRGRGGSSGRGRGRDGLRRGCDRGAYYFTEVV